MKKSAAQVVLLALLGAIPWCAHADAAGPPTYDRTETATLAAATSLREDVIASTKKLKSLAGVRVLGNHQKWAVKELPASLSQTVFLLNNNKIPLLLRPVNYWMSGAYSAESAGTATCAHIDVLPAGESCSLQFTLHAEGEGTYLEAFSLVYQEHRSGKPEVIAFPLSGVVSLSHSR